MPDFSKKITKEISISPEIAKEAGENIKTVLELKSAIEKYSQKSASELSEIIMIGGINLGASDIHMEPSDETVKIRARIDGMLQDIIEITSATYVTLLSRIKLLSGLKLNVSDRPQDGRFSVLTGEANGNLSAALEIRSSALPTEYGETIVLRILDPKNLIEVKDLGLRGDLLKIFQREIKKPNGMIIVTGPTGSGKTTTLYAFLKAIQKPEIKIITIEDPIEYHLPDISQTQVAEEKGYDFASGLQSIVRQDPDVILVGEVRDSETCQISIQAALTGHLVLTTLHTNDAAGTIARMTSLGADLENAGPALNLIIAQRLVRKICPKCAVSEKISEHDFKKINKFVLSALAAKIESGDVEVPEFTPNFNVLKPKGCIFCNNTGFKGRVGIYEAIVVDEDLENFIIKNPSIPDFKKEAIKKGMVTLYQDGLIKVLEKMTTIEEVERITGESE